MNKAWETKTLGELCDFYNGLWTGKKAPFVKVNVIRNTNFTKDCKFDDSDIASLDVEEKQYKSRKLKYGDLILEKSGGGPKQPVGRVIIFNKAEGQYSFSNFTSAIRVKDENELDFNYLYSILLRFYTTGVTEKMQSNTTGIRNLDFTTYKNLTIPVPPLDEQKRIVGVLDEKFEAIEKLTKITEQQIVDAKELFESRLNEVFENLMENHQVKSLEVCAEFKGGGTPSKSRPEFWNGDIPWVSPKDMKVDLIVDSEDHVTPLAVKSSSTNLIPVNSILIVVRSGILSRIIPLALTSREVTLNQDMKAIIPREGIIYSYLFYALKASSPYLLSKINKGATVHRLQTDFLTELPIAMPDIKIQQKVVKELNELSAKTKDLEVIYRQKIADLQELKKSYLEQAFTGKL